MNSYFLKFVTDAMIVNNINFFGKQHKKNTYSRFNQYEIIIIDEAHEHNINIDSIMSKMKHILFYNNEIKGVIISATMESDEPVYRSFYGIIDDDLYYVGNSF